MNNNAEQLSFFQLFKQKDYWVEIPIIQRDYAQGRNSAREIRESFLDALYDYVTSDSDMSKDLDFIYGSIEGENKDNFIPLDGQQRLTTLFLLHWYLANKCNNKNIFDQSLIADNKSKFTYLTRSSAKEFCDSLVRCGFLFDELSGNKLSNYLKNSYWYFESWDDDPTVKAMMTMLDAIHDKFNDCDQYVFNKLCNENKPTITFQFLNIDTHGLTDDLYIKMNSRGKLLEDFENFKAKFEQYLKNNLDKLPSYEVSFNGENRRRLSADSYFSHNIDTVWADLFWKYRNKLRNTYDAEIMNFIRLVIFNNNVIEQNSNANFLMEGNGRLKELSFAEYKKKNCLRNSLITHLIAILDLLKNDCNPIRKYLPVECHYYDEEKVFRKAISNSTNYQDKLRFYAFYSYLSKNKDINSLKEWMRIIFNLTENTRYDTYNEFVRSIISIKNLLDIDKFLDHFQMPDSKVTGFLLAQIFEERIKSHLIDKNKEWNAAILDAEKHPYFLGQIGFILAFSGITDYYNKHGNCNWDAKTDKELLEKFNLYRDKSSTVFNLIEYDSSDMDYLWERAVLSKGNYFLEASADRLNMLSSRSGKNIVRDYSWKRLLQLVCPDTANPEYWINRQKYVKEVFDDSSFVLDDAENSLQKICDTSLQNEYLPLWRKLLIMDSSLIKYCKQGYMRYDSEKDIQLLGQSQQNHYHVELYTYALYKHLKNENLRSLTYHEVKSSWEDAYIEVRLKNNLEFKVLFNYKFIIKFNREVFDNIQKHFPNDNNITINNGNVYFPFGQNDICAQVVFLFIKKLIELEE